MWRSYPRDVVINGSRFYIERVLKDDFFSVNVLYRSEDEQRYVLKLSDFRFLFGYVLRPLAALISRHEYRVYQRLADLEGIPELGPRWGWRGYFHRYIDGKTLHEITPNGSLPRDFFDRLGRILSHVHQRRVWYVDLNKQGNIICATDGRPYLIDFQISILMPHWNGRLGAWMDRVFHRLAREDWYHLYKHKNSFQPSRMTEPERRLARRSKLNAWYARLLGRPYLRVKRLIYPHGSNEIVWYKWRRVKDKTMQMP